MSSRAFLGAIRDRRIVMEAHMDTASITGMTIPPFEPTVSRTAFSTAAVLATQRPVSQP